MIVEGVETQEHANLLSLLGCPLAQGYDYARLTPVTAVMNDRARPSGVVTA